MIKRKNVLIFVFIFLVSFTFVKAESGTIYVPDNYSTIQAAVNASSSGDTIIVRDGIYTENVIITNQNLTIQSEHSRDYTIIKPENLSKWVFTVEADFVHIQGFRIMGKLDIFLNNSNFCNISENLFDYYLIENISSQFAAQKCLVLSHSNNTFVYENKFYMCGEGIRVEYSENNSFISNDFSKCGSGIKLDSYSKKNNIIKNIFRNDTGIGGAAIVVASQYNLIVNNTFNNTSGEFGSLKISSSNNIVQDNIFTNIAITAIQVCGHENIITQNKIQHSYSGIHIGFGWTCLCYNNTINNNHFINNIYHGILLQDYNVHYTTIKNNIFEDSGIIIQNDDNNIENNTVNEKKLVYLEDVDNITIEDAGQVILVNVNNAIIQNCTIRNVYQPITLRYSNNCQIKNNNLTRSLPLTGYGIYLFYSSNNSVNSNTIDNFSLAISLSASSHNNIISDNQMEGYYDGISIIGSRNLIKNNKLDGFKKGGYGIVVIGVENKIQQNKIQNKGHGIFVGYDSEDNIIENNEIIDNTYGITTQSAGTRIMFNYIFGNDERGINNGNQQSIIANNQLVSNKIGLYLSDADNSFVTDNFFQNNTYGVYTKNTDYNDIQNNFFSDNQQSIYLSDRSDNNTFSRNSIQKSSKAMFISESFGNRIYLNDFINNTLNLDSNSINNWTSPKAMNYDYKGKKYTDYLGNHYSDYLGIDIDRNGIGDIPYTNGLEEDDYPLMEPIKEYLRANPWVELLGRDAARVGRFSTCWVIYGNSGNAASYDNLLYIRFPNTAEYTVEYPLPPLDGINWSLLTHTVRDGSDFVIPIWLLKMEPNSFHSFPIRIKPTQGDTIEITAELLTANKNRFSETGNYAYLQESPVFQSLVQATSQEIAEHNPQYSPGYFDQEIRDGYQNILEGYDSMLFPTWSITGATLGIIATCLTGNPFFVYLGVELGVVADTIQTGYHLLQAGQHFTRAHFSKIEWLILYSSSPEDKYGPPGFDIQATPIKERFVSVNEQFYYLIDFWNSENATAPAQDVIIIDDLGQNLNWSSFRFIEVGFLNFTIPLEPNQFFNISVNLKPVMNLTVKVNGTFNISTGRIEWNFRSLDPETLEPPEDPNLGFLPPITESGYEIGWVLFSVFPNNNITTGTNISNQAFVKFDVAGFNPAPKDGPFINTIDNSPPISNIIASLINYNLIELNISGTDVGSGIKDYSIYYSVDNLPYKLWIEHTNKTHLLFEGEEGRVYRFYSLARDNVYNVEELIVLAGDVNGDCKVDIFDLAKVGLCYGKAASGSCLAADLKTDGKIDIFDLAAVGLNYGRSC